MLQEEQVHQNQPVEEDWKMSPSLTVLDFCCDMHIAESDNSMDTFCLVSMVEDAGDGVGNTYQTS